MKTYIFNYKILYHLCSYATPIDEFMKKKINLRIVDANITEYKCHE